MEPDEQMGYKSKRRSRSLRKVPDAGEIDWDKPYLKLEKRPNDLIEMAITERIKLRVGQKTRHWGVLLALSVLSILLGIIYTYSVFCHLLGIILKN